MIRLNYILEMHLRFGATSNIVNVGPGGGNVEGIHVPQGSYAVGKYATTQDPTDAKGMIFPDGTVGFTSNSNSADSGTTSTEVLPPAPGSNLRRVVFNGQGKPADAMTPEQLKSQEGTLYVIENGNLITYIWPDGTTTQTEKGNNQVQLNNGGVLHPNMYLNRGVEVVLNNNIFANEALCAQIMGLKFANIPATNTRVGSCPAPFCLCQLSVDRVRAYLYQVPLWCVRELLVGSPNKDTLCAVFTLLQNAGILTVNYPFQNYYPVIDPDPFFLLGGPFVPPPSYGPVFGGWFF